MRIEDLFRRKRRPRPPSAQTVIGRHIGKAIAAVILAGAAGLFGLGKDKVSSSKNINSQVVVAQHAQLDGFKNKITIKALLEKRELSFTEISSAKVVKLLRNDNKGARHQRWLVQLEDGSEVMAVYNLDLSEKVPVSVGDEVDLAGELTYADRGGKPLIHWLHADPKRKRPDGYVRLNGKNYGRLDAN